MRCANMGFAAPNGVAFSAPLSEKRSHSSSAGSAFGDLYALTSFLTLTAGVFGLELLGEEVGEELRALFLPLRESIGDKAEDMGSPS